MNRILLVILLFSSTAVTGYSQCTPDPLYADSLFGVWPDTTTNFISGLLNEDYFQQLDIAVPSNASQVPDAGLPPFAIDSGAVVGVVGLPAGIDFACNSHTGAPCTYIGGTQGCAIVEGIPTEAGLFELTVELNVYLFGLSYPVTFEGYRIFIQDPLGVEDETLKPRLSQNVPNPFAVRTTIPFSLGSAEIVDFKVMDLLGQEVFSQKLEGKFGTNEYLFEPQGLESGIYLYSIESSAGTITRRMVLDRP